MCAKRSATVGVLAALVVLAAAFGLAQASAEIVEVSLLDESLGDHHVDAYRIGRSGHVVRRGFPFQMSVVTNGTIPDSCGFQLYTSKRKINFTVTVAERLPDNVFLLNVTTAADAQIDRYHDLRLVIKGAAHHERFEFSYPWPLYVIYNPYNPRDQGTYWGPDSLDELEGYLNDEYGIIFEGSAHDYEGTRWFYGQHDEDALLAAFHLLRDCPDTSDPAHTTKYLATRVMWDERGNPDGVLEGRWEETYPEGTSPELWTSSDKIIKMYHFQGRERVQYGQCWVFAALTNTFVRTIGIPSRQLTAFGAAIDQTYAVDKRFHHIVVQHYTPEGRLLASEGSVWNFHSWVDIHIRRPDLGTDEFDGWQALDGVWPGLGPASVRAVHDLKEEVNWNTSIVISTVHSSVMDVLEICDMTAPGTGRTNMSWVLEHCQTNTTLQYEKGSVRLMLTKSPVFGDFSGMDITELYADRQVDAFVPFNVNARSLPPPRPDTGVELSIKAKQPRAVVGCAVEAAISLKLAHLARGDGEVVDVHIVAQLADNHGHYHDVVGDHHTTVRVGPEGLDIAFVVAPEAYMGRNLFNGNIEIRTIAHVRGTGSYNMDKTTVRLMMPKATVTAPWWIDTSDHASKNIFHLEFANTLPHPVFSLTVQLHSPSLPDIHDLTQTFPVILPGQTVAVSRLLTNIRQGTHNILAALSADGLPTAQQEVDIVAV